MYTVPCTLYHVHCTMYTVPCTLYHVHCTMYTVPCTLYHVHCTMYTVPCTLYHVHCIMYTVPCTLYTVQCTVYTHTSYWLFNLISNTHTLQPHDVFHKFEPQKQTWRNPNDPRLYSSCHSDQIGLSDDRNAYYNYHKEVHRNLPAYHGLSWIYIYIYK